MDSEAKDQNIALDPAAVRLFHVNAEDLMNHCLAQDRKEEHYVGCSTVIHTYSSNAQTRITCSVTDQH